MGKTKNEFFEWIQAIVIAVVLAFLIRTFLFENIEVDGSSMVPSLHDSDRIVVTKIQYKIAPPRRKDIIVFKSPSNPKENFIKRVIALEGEIVEILDGIVYINGEALSEPYIKEPPAEDFPAIEIPQNTVFVLGDNRNSSRDSRYPSVGCIPLKNIIGKAQVRIWPLRDLHWFR